MRSRFAIGLLAMAMISPASAQAQPEELASLAAACVDAAVWYRERPGMAPQIWTQGAEPAPAGFPVPDPSFLPIEFDGPTYPHVTLAGADPVVVAAPVIGVDSTHDNAYSLRSDCPRFAAFQTLLTADGALVVDFNTPFDLDCTGGDCPGAAYLAALGALDILVIAEPESIGADEAAFLRDWVSGEVLCADGCEGRGMIVLGSQERPNLGAELGVVWNYNRAAENAIGAEFAICGGSDADDDGTVLSDVMYDSGALIDPHVVSRGFGARHAVFSVKSFITNLFFWQYGAYHHNHHSAIRHGNATIALPTSQPSISFLTHEESDESAGVGLVLGEGRVFAGVDPEMFTAVIAAPYCWKAFPMPVKTCTPAEPIGMQVHPPNQQFLLNIVHWVNGILPDADGDGITDENDQCLWARPEEWPYYY